MLEGHLLNERYEIKSIIGGGGMANVYLGYDRILNRDVAIKILRLEYANDEEFIARFHREAEAATSLAHPNIVNIYDVGEENHILYMVMEYVEGLTLKEYIQKYSPISVEEALEIMKQVTSAIAHAHANNLIHRDIKPQNILINNNGQVKVTDFGIAIALSATSLTQTNSILGSVHYLSPEQARGGYATKKSDIYSLGIVLFELLTGRLPFMGHSPVSIALKHLQTNTPSVRRFNESVPQSVENIVLKATAKDPFHRYSDVEEMELALATALDPDKINEPKYVPPVEAGEETKAIPIITDDQLEAQMNQETIIHQSEDTTKSFFADNQGIDKPPKKEKKSNKKWWWIGGSVVLLTAAILALFFIPKWLKPKEIEVPDLINWTLEEAIDHLEELGLNVEKEYMVSDEVDEGHIIRTNPRAGRKVIEDATVTLFVSSGKERFVFEDYVGRDINQARRILENLGYEDIVVYEINSDKPVGEIITQIQPEPNENVIPSETTVIFEVSVGPELVTLIDLKGLTEDEVADYLAKNELKMNKREENSETVPEGLVTKQSPEPNSQITKGTTVDVYFSTGPEEKPPLLQRITFTVPYVLSNDPPSATDKEGGENEGNEGAEDPDPLPPLEQHVQIYIGDMNNHISDVYLEDYITASKEYTITLTIEPKRSAEYRVVSNGQLIIHEIVPYEEGE